MCMWFIDKSQNPPVAHMQETTFASFDNLKPGELIRESPEPDSLVYAAQCGQSAVQNRRGPEKVVVCQSVEQIQESGAVICPICQKAFESMLV